MDRERVGGIGVNAPDFQPFPARNQVLT